MKKLLLLFAMAVSSMAFAGGGLKFEKAVKNEILFLKDSKTFDEYERAAKSLKEIANNNTDRWEGFYWTAYALLRQASICEDAVSKARILKEADHFIYRAELLKKEYDELYVLKMWYYIEMIRTAPDPNEAKYGDKRALWLKKAYDKNGLNPRFYYVRAYEEFNQGPDDPEQREKAKVYFESAVQMYAEEKKPGLGNNPLAPDWGKDDAELMSILLEGDINQTADTTPGVFDEVGDPTENDGDSSLEINESAESDEGDDKKKKKKKKKKEKKDKKGGLFSF